ncbi:MAG: hypothetical protein JXR51_03745 [Bacteroidales bacterium]|nr:hypothetical protein [Bacteroidales bacterium]MBN2756267.1 hypothetical protein [Bacteroidales bacterium]
MKKLSLILFFAILILEIGFEIKAADFNKDIEVLVLTKKNGKVKYIKSGKKIIIWTNAGEKIKGKIEDISNNSVVVKNKKYELADIKAIRVNYQAAKISGAVIGVGGLLSTYIGMAIYIDLISKGTIAGQLFAVLIGLPIAALGVLLITAGVLVFTIGKKHKLSKNWKFTTAQIAE